MASYTLRKIDDQLWRQVKSLAALKGKTLKDFILDLLRQAVKEG